MNVDCTITVVSDFESKQPNIVPTNMHKTKKYTSVKHWIYCLVDMLEM